MSSFINIKPQILYAPMLATFGGGSSRGFGRGIGGGGADLDIRVNATKNTADNVNRQVASGGSLLLYQNAATTANGSALDAEGKAQILSRIGDGILHLKASAGDYTFSARSSSGSGANSGTFKEASGKLTFSTDMDLLLLVPNNGIADYGGGGGFFLASANNPAAITFNDMTSANAILVIGGGGGGYSGVSTFGLPGPMTDSIATASVRRGPSSPQYEGGAGFLVGYTISYGTAATRPHHFIQGGRGSFWNGSCGGDMGGFGGGGGSCPAGGGGYVGGLGGTNTGGARGGGGGTSYYNSSIITEINESNPTMRIGTLSDLDVANSGFFAIAPA